MATPGWYPNPQNAREEIFWDGSQWTASRHKQKGGSSAWMWVGIAAGALVVAIAVVLGVMVINAASSLRPSIGAAPTTSSAPQQQPDSRAQQLKDQGYEQIERGIFVKWAAEGSYTCEYWSCSKLEVVAVDGCANSLYVEAAILTGSTQIGMTNELTTALRPMERAEVTLVDHTSKGNGFRVTKASCY